MMKKDLITINNKVIKITNKIGILDKISWPAHIEQIFLEALKNGKKPILKFSYEKFDLSDSKKELQKLKSYLSKENPLHIYTALTIDSYCNSIDMIHSIGTNTFQELSILEYGKPTHLLFEGKYSHLETAKSFIEGFTDYEHPYMVEPDKSFSALELRKFLMKESKKVFGKHTPKIVLTDEITAKATAGRKRVRLRQNALFSIYDFNQLFVHEIMTHSLTAINGSLQSQLPILSLGAPRTTKTQEGLATFSEIISGSLDLSRLKRISLRVVALESALNGADFYDLFDYFLSNGQSEKESYLSASRILRGGFHKGGVAFTKDGVYLEGLIRVHSFFRWAFKTKNLDLTHLLFCGRVDINDIFLLKSAYENGFIEPPKFLPGWYEKIDLLAGKMAFSLILNDIDLDSVSNHYTAKVNKRAG